MHPGTHPNRWLFLPVTPQKRTQTSTPTVKSFRNVPQYATFGWEGLLGTLSRNWFECKYGIHHSANMISEFDFLEPTGSYFKANAIHNGVLELLKCILVESRRKSFIHIVVYFGNLSCGSSGKTASDNFSLKYRIGCSIRTGTFHRCRGWLRLS
jgi:hypothetical protein